MLPVYIPLRLPATPFQCVAYLWFVSWSLACGTGEAVKCRPWALASTAVSCCYRGSSLALDLFLIRIMVSATQITDQKRFQKLREQNEIAKNYRKRKAYQLKDRGPKRRGLANSKIRVEAQLRKATKCFLSHCALVSAY